MIDDLLQKYPLVSDQVDRVELRVLLRELERSLTLNSEGTVVEFGCFEGTASLFMQRLLLANGGREFHVYDSFAGLPEKTAADGSPAGEQFKAGELHASKQTFIRNFARANVQLPIVHKGWFGDIQPQDVPNNITFAFLDGDFYESIRDSLQAIENKLAPQATIVVDDYQSEALPGAAKAVDSWRASRQHRLRTEASLAILYI